MAHCTPATVCRPVDLFLFNQLAGTEAAATELFQTFGILPLSFKCQMCAARIGHFRVFKGSVMWRCPTRSCRSSRTVRTDSRFLSCDDNRNRLRLSQIAGLVYSWTMHLTLPLASVHSGVTTTTVSRYFNLFRDVCFEALVLHEQENGPDPFIASLGVADSAEPPLKAPRDVGGHAQPMAATGSGESGNNDRDFDAHCSAGFPSTTMANGESASSPSWRQIAAKYRNFARLDKRRMPNAAQRKSIGNNMPRHVAEEWWRSRMAPCPGYPCRALFEEFLKLVGRSKVYGCHAIVEANRLGDYIGDDDDDDDDHEGTPVATDQSNGNDHAAVNCVTPADDDFL